MSDMRQSVATANIYNRIIECTVITASAYLITIGSIGLIYPRDIADGIIGLIFFIVGFTLHDRFFELKKKKTKEIDVMNELANIPNNCIIRHFIVLVILLAGLIFILW